MVEPVADETPEGAVLPGVLVRELDQVGLELPERRLAIPEPPQDRHAVLVLLVLHLELLEGGALGEDGEQDDIEVELERAGLRDRVVHVFKVPYYSALLTSGLA